MVGQVLMMVSMEVMVLWMCTQAIVLLIIETSFVPTIDPYIPRAKRPPLYLQSLLSWINTTIDEVVVSLAPLIICRTSTPCSVFYPPYSPPPAPEYQFYQRFKHLQCLIPQCFKSLFTRFWTHNYLFCKWNFAWWDARHRQPLHPSRRRRILALSAINAGVARAHAAAPSRQSSSRVIFDSDSFDILVDGGATSCISNSLSDFIKPPQDSNVRVKGFHGTTSAIKIGTVVWNILDDSGQRHALKIPDTYYVPACPLRLLSPQHYSQIRDDVRGTYSTNFGDQVLFVFHKGRFQATMPLSTHINVGILRSAPGHRVFSSFIDMEYDPSPTHFCCPVVTDDEADALDSDEEDDATLSSAASLEGDDEDDFNATSTPSAPAPPHLDEQVDPPSTDAQTSATDERPNVIPFDLDHDEEHPANLAPQDDVTSSLDNRSELLRWHYRLGHLPFANLRLMAAREEIPKRLASCRIPKCQSCLYGKATKRPWRSKGQTNKIRTVTKPGECVSVDQLESPVPGFIGQNKGYFFRKRYKVATIFVDHFSRLSFVYLQESTKGEETLLAKRAFETYAASFGVTILNYHPPFCPVYYVLHSGLQGGGKRPNKWVRKSRIAVYLGSSPRHARSVALVLSLLTGYVSPQFHLKFDDFFETVQDTTSLPQSKWQLLSGFITSKGKKQQTATPQQGVSTQSPDPRSSSHNNDPLEFDLVDPDRETDQSSAQEPSDPDLLPLEHREEAAPVRTPHPDATRRSTRKTTPIRHYMHETAHAVLDDTDAIEDYEVQTAAEDPIAFAASKSDPDTLNFKDAMNAEDSAAFKKAMLKECDAHTDNEHWEVWAKADVPPEQDILPAVWAFKRKRRIDTRKVYKYKARINIHGGMQKHGVNYWETYSPVVNWFSIRLCLILVMLFKWSTRQIDFVLAFPQADVECDLFMQLPRGLTFEGVHRNTHCLKLVKNLYGQRQAGRVWNHHLVDGLVNKLQFTQSKIDECVFYRGTTMLLIYVDDGILCGASAAEIRTIVKELSALFDVTDEGEIDTYLGVKISRPTPDTIELTQPHLIQQILDDLGMKSNSKTKDKAAPSSTILRRDVNGAPFNESWDYRSVVGKLNFLEKSTRPEIAYAVHQCARFSSDPKQSHANAVKYLCRYLLATKTKGLLLHPDPNKSFEVHVDCDFAGNWVKEDAMNDPSTAKSRTGYIISYGGCPVLWASKLQTEVVLSSTESEYVGLSESLRIAIVMMGLLLEMKSFGIPISKTTPKVFCKLFEDNAGAIHLAKVPKMRPRTRHINQKYHHFREWVKSGLIEILPIDTLEQPADLMTKPLDLASFVKHRKAIMGW